MDTAKLYLFDPSAEGEYIPVNPDEVPCTFRIKLWDRTYELFIRYNETGGFYTADLSTTTGEVLAYGDPIRYGRPLFGAIEDERFPLPVIIPYAKQSGIEAVTRENFGVDVKLWLFPRWTKATAMTEAV